VRGAIPAPVITGRPAHYTPDTTADYAHLAIGDAFKLACWQVALLPNLRLRREQNSQLSIDRGPIRG